MIALFSCTIPGDPRGKGSVRVARTGHAYKDDKTDAYMGVCMTFMRSAHQGQGALDGCLRVEIAVFVRRPDRLIPNPRGRKEQPPAHAFAAPTKPDLDNCSKAICDALTQAGIIEDDKRITFLVMRKRYVAMGESPRVEVAIWPDDAAWIAECARLGEER